MRRWLLHVNVSRKGYGNALIGRYGGCFEEGYKGVYDDSAYHAKGFVRPHMRYCSISRCFHPDPGTKHISVPPRHMTMPYAPDFQHDITTLQIKGYNISYNRHTTASNTIQQRKIKV